MGFFISDKNARILEIIFEIFQEKAYKNKKPYFKPTQVDW